MEINDIGRCKKCNHPTLPRRDWPYFWRKKKVCTNCGDEVPLNYDYDPYQSCIFAGNCSHVDGMDCPGTDKKCDLAKTFGDETGPIPSGHIRW